MTQYRQDPSYADGYYDALDMEVLPLGASAAYVAGWEAARWARQTLEACDPGTSTQRPTPPREPTEAMIDRGVAYALNVTVAGEGGWSKYVAELYRRMVSAVP